MSPRGQVDRDWLVATLAELVHTNSINPAFGGGGTNEAAAAALTGEVLRDLGTDIEVREPAPGRTSVVGRVAGRGGGPSLMLYAHLDTVGVEGMAEPFAAEVRDGRMYGRGAYDMKSGLAACLAAVRTLRDAGVVLRGDLLVVAVADEEEASLGIADVLRDLRADAAVVTEPTELALCIAHKGFCWIEVETQGRAAHGSRYDEGIDANLRMGRLLARLEPLERALRDGTAHPLVGPGSMHAGVLHGGTGPSIYAERCRLVLERRTLPGDSEEEVLGPIRAIVAEMESEDPTFRATVRPILTRAPFEVDPHAPIVTAVAESAVEVLGAPPRVIGAPFWMDAAFLASAGIPTAVIGAVGAGAHAAEEWVDLASVVSVAEILVGTALRHCGVANAP